MTTKFVVSDEQLGVIGNRYWDLLRRVKEGTLDPVKVANGIQRLSENEFGDVFNFEKIPWKISSMVHEVICYEGTDFCKEIKARGIKMDLSCVIPFVISGSGKSKIVRLRTAKLDNNTDISLVRHYAQLCGFELGTSWDLLAFLQSSFMVTLHRGISFTALGNSARILYSDGSGGSINHVVLRGGEREYSFAYNSLTYVACNGYILLKEKEEPKPKKVRSKKTT